jgi:ApeA N-terminal domain 1
MRIEEEYKKAGYFWLPDKQEKKIPGILTILDGGKIELETVGLFDEITNFLNNEFNLGRIVGHIEKDGLVTLEGCLYTKKNISYGGIAKSLIHVHRVLSGVAYDKDEEVTFNTLSFSVDCIDEWVGISGINVVHDNDNKTATISYNPPSNFSYSLVNGMKLEVRFSYTLPGWPNITEAKITQNAYFELISEKPRPLTDFTEVAFKITNLLCFAIDETVSLEGLIATSNEINRDVGNGKSYHIPIYVYYQSIPFSEKKPSVNKHEMIFTFGVIKENAENVFNKWLTAYESLAPALSLYFSTKIDAQKYLSGKFLALAQGLETFHRRISNEKLMDDSEFEDLVKSIMKHCPVEKADWLQGRLMYGNEINLGKRIKKIIEPFKEHIGTNEDRNKIIHKIVNTRNYLTHYDESLKSETVEGKDLFMLCMKMEAIFQLHYLKILGFTNEEVSNVVKNCYSLKRKLKET